MTLKLLNEIKDPGKDIPLLMNKDQFREPGAPSTARHPLLQDFPVSLTLCLCGLSMINPGHGN